MSMSCAQIWIKDIYILVFLKTINNTTCMSMSCAQVWIKDIYILVFLKTVNNTTCMLMSCAQVWIKDIYILVLKKLISFYLWPWILCINSLFQKQWRNYQNWAKPRYILQYRPDKGFKGIIMNRTCPPFFMEGHLNINNSSFSILSDYPSLVPTYGSESFI